MAAPFTTASSPSFPATGHPAMASARAERMPARRLKPDRHGRLWLKPNRHGRFWKVVAFGAHPGIPGGLLTGWWLWELLGARLHPTTVVPGSPFGLFRIRLERYHGRPIELADSAVTEGTPICELHCDNRAVLRFTQASSAIYRAGRMELRAIANYLVESNVPFEAIHGVTLLGAAAARLGFHRRAMPLTGWTRAVRLFMNGLLALYNVDGVARLKRGRTLHAAPEEIWMSRAELLGIYADPKRHSFNGGQRRIAISGQRTRPALNGRAERADADPTQQTLNLPKPPEAKEPIG